MKRYYLLFVLTIVIALASVALAEQGQWAYSYANNSAASSGFLAVSAIDQDTAFSIGINQFSADGAQYAWRTTDAGITWVPIFQMEFSTQGCDILNLFSFMIDGDWFDVDHGIIVGTAVDPECCPKCMNEGHKFAYCMIRCMIAMKPFFWTATDGGDTIERHSAEGNITTMYTDIRAIDQETMVACGSNGLLRKTSDFGQSWTDINPPETGEYSIMNTMSWLSPDVGFIGTGEDASSTGRAPMPDDVASVIAFNNKVQDYIRYLHGGAWRLDLLDHGYRPDYRNDPNLGKVYKTIDGGANWQPLLSGNGVYGFLKVFFLNEQRGWVITDEVLNPEGALNNIKYTDDGGVTWHDAGIPNVGPAGSTRYIISDMRMLTPDLGYAVGANAHGFFYGTNIMVTIDGGKTWAFDDIGALPQYHGSSQGYGLNSVDFASNRRGYAVGMYLSAVQYTGTNSPPTADAGADQTVAADTSVTLDGSGSSDPDNDTLLFKWTQLDGPHSVTISDAFAAQPTFTATDPGAYVFSLDVSDGEFTDTAETTVTVPSPADDDSTGADDDASHGGDDDSSGDNGGGGGGGCGF